MPSTSLNLPRPTPERELWLEQKRKMFDAHRETHLTAEHVQQIRDAFKSYPLVVAQADAVLAALQEEELGVGHGNAVVVDLDEAVHGLYAAVSYAMVGASKGSSHIVQELRADADLMAEKPLTWLQESTHAHGAGDLGVSIAVSAVLIPLAFLAMHAGVHEIKHAWHCARVLDARMAKNKEELQALSEVSGRHAPWREQQIELLQRELARLLLAKKELEFVREQVQWDKHIGAYTLISGASIAARAATDTSVKIATAAAGQGATGMTLTTTAASILGNFFLGPIAAVGAVGLGVSMVAKSHRRNASFIGEKKSAEQYLQRMPATPDNKSYLAFSNEKLRQHRYFYRHFARWNKGFLVGSSIYAASTFVKFIALILAFAAGVSLGPVGLGLLLAGGTIGGILMGVCSHQFLFGHGRQGRYQRYSQSDDHELDRHFLGVLDTLCAAGGSHVPEAAFNLRAQFFDKTVSQENARQDFLYKAAQSLGKRYAGCQAHSTDASDIKLLRKTQATHNRSRKTSWQAAASALGTLCKTLSWKQAKAVWNEQKDSLSQQGLAKWLDQPQNYAEQMGFVRATLERQVAYLKEKIELKINALSQLNEQAKGQVKGQEQAEINLPVFTKLDAGLEQDLRVLKKINHLLVVSQAGNMAQTERDVIVQEFVALQMGTTNQKASEPARGHAKTPQLSASQKLAKFMLEDAPSRNRDLRGMLLECEVQAAKVHEKIQTHEKTSSHHTVRAGATPVTTCRSASCQSSRLHSSHRSDRAGRTTG